LDDSVDDSEGANFAAAPTGNAVSENPLQDLLGLFDQVSLGPSNAQNTLNGTMNTSASLGGAFQQAPRQQEDLLGGLF
jgi:hypothetical protein